MTEEKKPLSDKHQEFVNQYFLCGMNATQAYMNAYPDSSYNAARGSAHELLANPNIQAEISARMNARKMSVDEALVRLSDFAQGDLGEFTNNFGGVDWVEAREKGLTKLVKKWKVRTVTINGKEEEKQITTEEIELHDPQAALDKILRAHGAYKDNDGIGNALMEIAKRIGVDTDKL